MYKHYSEVKDLDSILPALTDQLTPEHYPMQLALQRTKESENDYRIVISARKTDGELLQLIDATVDNSTAYTDIVLAYFNKSPRGYVEHCRSLYRS